jgi:hypothetical protein
MTFEKALTLSAEDINEKNAQEVCEALHGEKLSKAEMEVRYTRRILAVKKDQTRKKEGKKAARFYRGDERALDKGLREKVGSALAKVDDERTPEPSEPAPKAKKPAPVLVTPKAPAKKAAAPKVKKAPAAAQGGAVVSF